MTGSVVTGSRVYGKPREDSDLDLAILIESVRFVQAQGSSYPTRGTLEL